MERGTDLDLYLFRRPVSNHKIVGVLHMADNHFVDLVARNTKRFGKDDPAQ